MQLMKCLSKRLIEELHLVKPLFLMSANKNAVMID